jgi:starch-binding outer membrane protein, SusD/RagB family
MSMYRIIRGLSAASLLVIGSCKSLDIENPNDPDNVRALSDPDAIEAVAAGSMRTWFNAWTPLRSGGTLAMQARTHASSWNNGNNNFYSGVDIGPNDTVTSPATWTRGTRSWQNDPAAAARTSVDAFWSGGLDESGTSRPGFYAVLSAANSALTAIRKNGVVIGDAEQTARAETIAQLMQGAALMGIALNFDKGYVVDEDTDLSALTYSDRKAMRDAAVTKLNAAYTLATANTFTTDDEWTGGGGFVYTNTDIAKIAKTMVAMTLAWYPRDAAEAASEVNWADVLAAAALGMSSGSPVDLMFEGDGCAAWCQEMVVWMNSMDTGRIWTRLAHLLDPPTQRDPYPLGPGNLQPNSADRRLGDGSFGVASMQAGFGNIPKTANGGTDFAYSTSGAIMRPDRGFYQQSNIAHIRYDATGTQSPTGIYFGFGPSPVINHHLNDILWAEAALRVGGVANIATAVSKINNTRVTRGGLPAALVADLLGAPDDGPCMSTGVKAKDGTVCTLWSKLLYEAEIELLGLGPSGYYNHRHLPVVLATGWERPVGYTGIYNGPRYIQGLLPGTPREMPVPYKELGVKGEALYTFGGAQPDKSATPP